MRAQPFDHSSEPPGLSGEADVEFTVRRLWKGMDGYEVTIDLSSAFSSGFEVEIRTPTDDAAEAIEMSRVALVSIGKSLAERATREGSLK